MLVFEPEEVKERLSSAFAHGDLKRIADANGFAYDLFKKRFEASSDKECPAYPLLQAACSLADIDENRADEFMAILMDIYEQSKKRSVEPIDLGKEIIGAGSLVNQVTASLLNGNDRSEQLSKSGQAIRRLYKFRTGVINVIAGEPKELLTPDSILPPEVREMIRTRYGKR